MKSNHDNGWSKQWTGAERPIQAQWTIELCDYIRYAKANNGRMVRLGPDGTVIALRLHVDFPGHPPLNRVLGDCTDKMCRLAFLVRLHDTAEKQAMAIHEFVHHAQGYGSLITVKWLREIIENDRPGFLKAS